MINVLYALSDGIFISIFSITIVFLILFVISIVIKSLKLIQEKAIVIPYQAPVQNSLSIDDITDEDMMVAALIASIDYQNITNGDVRVTKIRMIKDKGDMLTKKSI